MSFTRKSATTWELVYLDGDRNSSMDVEATVDGIEVDGSILGWDEIDAARKALQLPETP